MSRAREFADLAGSADAGGLTGRNLIINGAMQVAQRGTSQSSVTATGYYCVDRFKVSDSISTLVTTVSQSTDAAAGFEYSKKIDVTTANASPSASEYFVIQQSIEAQDLEKLQYGTSAAKSLTLSFYVKSPKTGTHYAELAIPSGQFFSKPYTINSANTWEYKTLTFAGNTGQALVNSGTSAGIGVNFWLVAGSTFTSGTYSEVWSNTNANRLVGQVNVLDNAANDFYLTGVQLELGDTATPFEHRSYGDELAKCQRYYESLKGAFYNNASASHLMMFPYKVIKRAVPTVTRTANFWSGGESGPTLTVYNDTFVCSGATTPYLGGWFTVDAEL